MTGVMYMGRHLNDLPRMHELKQKESCETHWAMSPQCLGFNTWRLVPMEKAMHAPCIMYKPILMRMV
jgi:hypothetical protein